MSRLQQHLDINTTPSLGYPKSVILQRVSTQGTINKIKAFGSVPAPCGGFNPPEAAFTFLFSRELFCLFPDFSGIEEVGGDLDVAGSHLMDALRDRHRGPAP